MATTSNPWVPRNTALGMVNKIIVSSEQSIRFDELESMLDISPNTLSRRLEELVEVDFLERHLLRY